MSARQVPAGHISTSIAARLAELKRRFAAHHPALKVPASQKQNGEPDYGMVAELISANESTFGKRLGQPSAARVLLQAMAEEIGLMPLSEFIQHGGSAAALIVPAYHLDEVGPMVDAWGEDLLRRGMRVPEALTRPGCPQFNLIARELGVDPSRLLSKTCNARKILERWTRTLGFMSAEEYVARVNDERVAQKGGGAAVFLTQASPLVMAKREAAEALRADKLLVYLKTEYLDQCEPLPESTRSLGRPAYRAIASAASVTFFGKDSEPYLCGLIDAAAARVGTGPDAYRPLAAPPKTFNDLMARGVVWCQLSSGCLEPTNLARLQWALRQFVKAADCELSDPIGHSFEESFQAIVEKAGSSYPNASTAKQLRTELRTWVEVYKCHNQNNADSIPAGFGSALQFLMRKAKIVSLRELCRAANLDHHYGRIFPWSRGVHQPGSIDVDILNRLEVALCAEPGTLVSRIDLNQKFLARGRIPDELRPECLRTDALWRIARPILPKNFASLSSVEREQVGETIINEYKLTSPYRMKMQTAVFNRWRLVNFPARLQNEWNDLVAYKTLPIPPFPRRTKWNDGSVKRFRNVLIEIFSVLRLPVSEGGLGIANEDLSLALLGIPKVIKHYFQWKLDRSQDGLDTGTLTWAGMIASLATPEAGQKGKRRTSEVVPGYLHHLQSAASTLTPIPQVLSPESIASFATRSKWRKSLLEAWSTANTIINDTRGDWTYGRDPFSDILPLLQSPRPMDPVMDMLKSMFRDLPHPSECSAFERAVAVRRFISTLILFRTALRRENIVNLTVNDRNTGKLKKVDGLWIIEIPAKEFKNASSSHWRTRGARGITPEPYLHKFCEKDSEIIDEYVMISRRVLLGDGKDHERLLVGKSGKPMIDDFLTQEMHRHTWRYLVWHESTQTGLKGVRSFGCHAIRALTATHILKVDGDYHKAAAAIQDTVQTVIRHYLSFSSIDKGEIANNWLRNDLGSPYD